FHLSVVDQPGLLRYWSTGIEDDKVRYAANIEAGRQLGIALRVNLDDDGTASHIRCCAGDFRCGHLTRTTPCRPEIDQYGDACVLRDFVELLEVDFQRFVHRRQRGLTCSATPGFSKMFCRNPIFLPAALAGSHKRHLRSPSSPTQLGAVGDRGITPRILFL